MMLYQDVFEKSTDGMLIIKNDKFIECNNAAVKMLSYENKAQVLNTHPFEISPEFQGDGRTSVEKQKEILKYVAEHGSDTFEWIHLRANGEPFWVEVVLTDISNKTDEDKLFLVVWREIGEKKRLEQENAYQNMILNSILNSTSDLIFYKDYTNGDGVFIGINNEVEKLIGHPKEEIIGKTDIEFFGEEIGAGFREKDREVIKNEVDVVTQEWIAYADGHKKLFNTRKTVLRDGNNKAIGIMGISRDITKLHLYQQQLIEQTYIDELTQLGNRKSYNETIKKSLGLFNRYQTPFSLLIYDVDDFKHINDKYGHKEGDTVLVNLSAHIKSHIRENDYIFRIGGEEFVIILSNTTIDNATVLSEKIVKSVGESETISELERITISLGVTEVMQGDTVDSIYTRCDDLLYRSKKSGKNRVEVG
jgi:diguanylate cyclase (GGDEF)-like protein/PAS domain S-box-containing protein